PLCQALNARGVTYMQQSRFDEALGVWGVSADIAERNGLTSLRAVAQSNIANVMSARDLPDAETRLKDAIVLSRRVGDSYGRAVGTGNLMFWYLFSGDWDEMERLANELFEGPPENQDDTHVRMTCLNAWRGEPGDAHTEALRSWAESFDIERRFIAQAAVNSLALSAGRYEALIVDGLAPVREAADALGP